MWRAALATLLSDATTHWQCKTYKLNATEDDLREAFEDLVECGPITHRLSSMCGLDPEYVSARLSAGVRGVEEGVTHSRAARQTSFLHSSI